MDLLSLLLFLARVSDAQLLLDESARVQHVCLQQYFIDLQLQDINTLQS